MALTTIDRKSFHALFAKAWKPDQHVSLIGPTGRGKSTTAKQILSRRPGKTLILAPKGPDKTLANFGVRTPSWPPPPWIDKRVRNGKLILRLEPRLKKPQDFDTMREHFKRAIEQCFRQGHWTVYIDELQVAADPRMMGLGKIIELIMITGRSRGTTIVSAVQAPRWVPRATYDQASHVILWRQRDKEGLKRVSEISGVDTKQVQAIVTDLDYHEMLWVDAGNDNLWRVGAS